MFTAIARDDRAAEKPASIAGAALKVHLSKLLLFDMVHMRKQASDGGWSLTEPLSLPALPWIRVCLLRP
jgi:hypothetical protein